MEYINEIKREMMWASQHTNKNGESSNTITTKTKILQSSKMLIKALKMTKKKKKRHESDNKKREKEKKQRIIQGEEREHESHFKRH